MALDIWETSKNWCGKSGAAYNKKGTITNSSTTVILTNTGIWKVHANVDYYFNGPEASTVAATTNSQFWVADDEFLIEVKKASQRVSFLRAGASSGTYHLSHLGGL